MDDEVVVCVTFIFLNSRSGGGSSGGGSGTWRGVLMAVGRRRRERR